MFGRGHCENEVAANVCVLADDVHRSCAREDSRALGREHSLSCQISESEIYLMVQESCRSPSSSLRSSLLRQTIRGFGNHCLWFRWGAVRKL